MNYLKINKQDNGDLTISSATNEEMSPSQLLRAGKCIARLKQVNVKLTIPVTKDYSKEYIYTPHGTILSNYLTD